MKRTLVRLTVLITASLLIEIAAPTQTRTGVQPLREEAPAATATVTGIGNVAVIQDDGSLVGHQNLFDLDQSTLRFTPRSEGGYFVEKIPLVWLARMRAVVVLPTPRGPQNR